MYTVAGIPYIPVGMPVYTQPYMGGIPAGMRPVPQPAVYVRMPYVRVPVLPWSRECAGCCVLAWAGLPTASGLDGPLIVPLPPPLPPPQT